MTLLVRVLSLLAVLSLSGCALFQEKISDYEQRSTVYGWLDIKDLSPNHLSSVVMYQHRPATDKPYYYMAFRKYQGGYLFYSHIPPKGAFKLDTLSGQSCLLFLCGNTIYQYNLGKQGDFGTAVINKPGVYYVGSYKLSKVKTGWLEQGKFSIEETGNGPSRKQMLELILQKDTPIEHPVVAERIRGELSRQ